MTAGFTFEATCPSCGGELLPISSEVKEPDFSTADARCDKCLTVWRIDVVATAVELWPSNRIDRQAMQDRIRERAGGYDVPSILA